MAHNVEGNWSGSVATDSGRFINLKFKWSILMEKSFGIQGDKVTLKWL